ncbi:hypothetical protein AGLY_007869 [Aphis glycines]|uniref:Uncharacterized protein n=1 Tax=Aphis glycines TaxID=307491 RepID=A0A6G0TNE9_APHGL|nr:hypothetical protein AGLY_007869 [Aphis glycines]
MLKKYNTECQIPAIAYKKIEVHLIRNVYNSVQKSHRFMLENVIVPIDYKPNKLSVTILHTILIPTDSRKYPDYRLAHDVNCVGMILRLYAIISYENIMISSYSPRFGKIILQPWTYFMNYHTCRNCSDSTYKSSPSSFNQVINNHTTIYTHINIIILKIRQAAISKSVNNTLVSHRQKKDKYILINHRYDILNNIKAYHSK